jgi:hypothetical protein
MTDEIYETDEGNVLVEPAPPNGNKRSKSTPAENVGVIKLRRIQRVTHQIEIVGTAPLIVNRFSEKAKAMMLEAQQTKARSAKEAKDPIALYEASRYRFPDGRDGFPAAAFKSAIVQAGRMFEGVTMTSLKVLIGVQGDGPDQLVPLEGEPHIHEAAVRNASGVADLRYRAMFDEWAATLYVVVPEKRIDVDSLFALVDAAGLGGVGEWRPTAPKSYSGAFGTFEVK